MALDTTKLPTLEEKIAAQAVADRKGLAGVMDPLLLPMRAAGTAIADTISLPFRAVGAGADLAARGSNALFGTGIEPPFGGQEFSMRPYADAAFPPPAQDSTPILPTLPRLDYTQDASAAPGGATGADVFKWRETAPRDRSTEVTQNVMPYGSGPSTGMSQALSAARQAAAERGDWAGVNASYGPGGLTGREPAPNRSAQIAFGGSGNPLSSIIQRNWDTQAQQARDRRADTEFKNTLLGMQTAQQGENIASQIRTREQLAGSRGLVDPVAQELKRAQIAHTLAQTGNANQLQALQAEYLHPGTTPERQMLLGKLLKVDNDKKQFFPSPYPGAPDYVFNQATGGVEAPNAAKEPSPADLEHTAKLRGLTVAQVRAQLGLK